MEVNPDHASLLFSTSDIISICAAIIALSALGVSIWQGVLTRRHHQVSVRPLIDLHTNLTTGENISIKLCNHGVGPALIKSISFLRGNSQFEVKNYGDYKALFSSLEIPLDKISHKLGYLTDSAALYQGAELELVFFESSKADGELHRKISTALEKLTLKIEYQCIYGNSYVFKAS